MKTITFFSFPQIMLHERRSSKNHFSVIDKNDLPLEITYHNNYLYAAFAENNAIEITIGENLGASWSSSSTIFTNENPITNPEIHSDGSNLYLVFEESVFDPIAGEMQTDICYLESSDNGSTWSDKQYYTTFIEKDYFSEVNLYNG
ncbi:MAG: sialidase family protein [Melioribacteraceae bacterium]|nr:sialidase family protein [Melioribacteraceae bacterium]